MAITRGTWKVRFFKSGEPDYGFFVEAPNLNMPELGYGIEIMQDDFGDHNGYPTEQRLSDAKAISAVPEMIEALQLVVESKIENADILKKCKSALEKAGY